jgi:hypothetical protein
VQAKFFGLSGEVGRPSRGRLSSLSHDGFKSVAEAKRITFVLPRCFITSKKIQKSVLIFVRKKIKRFVTSGCFFVLKVAEIAKNKR